MIKDLIKQLSERFEDSQDKELFMEAIKELEESEGEITVDDVLSLYEGIGNEKGEVDSGSAKKAESEMAKADSELVDELHKKFNEEPKKNQNPSENKTETDENPGVTAKAEKVDDFAKKLNDKAKEKVKDSKAMKEGVEVSTEINAIFEGSDFSEDFKEKASTILQTSIKTKIEENLNLIIESIIEVAATEYDVALDEVEEKLGRYLDYVSEEFIKENAIAIESGIKVEIAESIFNGIKTILVENNIEVPDEKLDIIDAVIEENDKIQEEYNNLIDQHLIMKEEVSVLKKEKIVTKIISEMDNTDLDKERIKKILEGVEYNDDESFKKKAGYIIEAYKPEVSDSTPKTKINESFEEEEAKELPKTPSSREAQSVSDYIKRNLV